MAPGTDERLMARAVRLAARGLYTADPNPRVGCVIARGEEVVGEGWHAVAGGDHAEAVALRAAGNRARGASVYLSLEPCCHHGRTPPCTDALIAAGVARVVCAQRDPDPRVAGRGFRQLEEAGIRVERLDRMAADARALNIGFIKRMTTGRPWVRVKLATSLDGRTALANGESQWITADAARTDVHRWRARASCILTGSGTVLADDPGLDVRLTLADLGLEGGPTPKPWVAIVDSGLRTPATARVFGRHDCVRIFTASTDTPATNALAAAGSEVIPLRQTGKGQVDLQDLLWELGRLRANEVHVEAGATLCGALLAAGLVDELIWYVAPSILGSDARGAFALPPLHAMTDRVRVHIQEVRHVGPDLRIRAYPIVDRDHERQ